MILYTDNARIFQEKLLALKEITNLQPLPEQLLKNINFKSVFLSDIFYQNPLLINSICAFSQKKRKSKIFIISIDFAVNTKNEESIQRVLRDPRWNEILETNYYPLLTIDGSCSYENIINQINKQPDGDIIGCIINGEVYSTIWVFDESKEWLICNQRPDITLFSTSNKELMDHILSHQGDAAVWIPKGYKIDRNNPPPYITQVEFDEGTISDATKSFTLSLLNNYQWKDWE